MAPETPAEPPARVAMVTGGGSGIGRAVARRLAADGFRVVVAGRRREPLDETVQDRAGGGEMVAVVADVTDEASVDRLFAETVQRFGRLDLLFNNAGTAAPPVPLEELDLAAWQRVVDTNLTGAFLCTRAAFRIMKAQRPGGGRIINNGSVSAHVPRPHSAPYTASKHAVTGLTRAAALDGRAHRIACGQIDIGNAGTDLLRALEDTGFQQADGSVRPEPTIDLRHVGDAVSYMAGLPLEANVLFLTVMATAMPLVGRG